MMKKSLIGFAALVLAAALAFYLLTMPRPLAADQIAEKGSGDVVRGESVFWAGGCASCHTSSSAGEPLALGGGPPLKTPIGILHAPNISPDRADGIGGWSLADFANAMQRGTSRDGRHYYPAFPYGSYARMTPGDVADLQAFLMTLPAVAERAAQNEIGFPYNLRRGIGLWKLAFLDDEPIVPLTPDASDAVRRGQYLVEGPGHCGECHTARTLDGLGGLDHQRWLAGGPNPEGQGTIPNITPSDKGLGSWTAEDIAYYFESGFTPDFDTVGGAMTSVQEHLARLTPQDRKAIAAYLQAIPPVD